MHRKPLVISQTIDSMYIRGYVCHIRENTIMKIEVAVVFWINCGTCYSLPLISHENPSVACTVWGAYNYVAEIYGIATYHMLWYPFVDHTPHKQCCSH